MHKQQVESDNDEGPLQSPDNRARLERMFLSHHSIVWRALRRRGLTEEAAADATQETFIVAARRLADIPPGSERAFLIATALRMAHTLRRKSARLYLDEDMDRHTERLGQRDADLADIEICDLVLARVESELVEVFILYELEGFTSPEIAALLQMPLGSVASRLRRAREQFRLALSRIHLMIEREQRQ